MPVRAHDRINTTQQVVDTYSRVIDFPLEHGENYLLVDYVNYELKHHLKSLSYGMITHGKYLTYNQARYGIDDASTIITVHDKESQHLVLTAACPNPSVGIIFDDNVLTLRGVAYLVTAVDLINLVIENKKDLLILCHVRSDLPPDWQRFEVDYYEIFEQTPYGTIMTDCAISHYRIAITYYSVKSAAYILRSIAICIW